MIEVYRETEDVIRETITLLDTVTVSGEDHYKIVDAYTFERNAISNYSYEDISVDLLPYPNLKNVLNTDKVIVKLNVEKQSDTYHAFVGSVFMVKYNRTRRDMTISPIGVYSIKSMKKDTYGIFSIIQSWYDNDKIIKEIGTGCHNYMINLYDIVEYYSDDNKFRHSDITLKNHKFAEWLDSNKIDIYNMTDEQKMMFDFEKNSIYEPFAFN